MRAGRPLYIRFRAGAGPSRREVLGALAFFVCLGALAWVSAVLTGGWS